MGRTSLKTGSDVRLPLVRSAPRRLCSNPFCFSDSQALQQSASDVSVLLGCCALSPHGGMDLAWETDVHHLILADSRSPLLTCCAGQFSKAPHLAPDCHIEEGNQLKPNSLKFFPIDSRIRSSHFFSFFLFFFCF